MAKKSEERALSLIEVAEILEKAPGAWLTTADVAAVTRLSISWLDAAREGRAGHEGPAFTKAGKARSSPVRYLAEHVRAWMKGFKFVVTTTGAQYQDHADFMARANGSETWLYVENRKELTRTPLAEAVERQLLGSPGTALKWVAKKDCDSWPYRARLSAEAIRALVGAGASDVNNGGDISDIVLELVSQARKARCPGN
jgi:hypothetical protein